MNDGIMNTWEVVVNNFWENHVMPIHVCAKLETAEYLRDWCEAIDEGIVRSISKDESDFSIRWASWSNKYEIQEGEVIL